MERYIVMDVLGKGSFGTVYKAYGEKGLIALKVVPLEDEKQTLYANREVVILKKISNPCVPSLACYYNSFIDNKNMYIEMEYIDGPDLKEFARKNRLLPHYFNKILAILKDIVPGLMYLHSHQIIHRDIKPENIVIERTKLQPTLIDVGIGCMPAPRKECPTGCCIGQSGSIHFMAPETLIKRQSYYESDIWSLGATIYFAATNENIFSAPSVPLYIEKVETDPVILHKTGHDKLDEVLTRMIVKNYEQRIPLSDLLEIISK